MTRPVVAFVVVAAVAGSARADGFDADSITPASSATSHLAVDDAQLATTGAVSFAAGLIVTRDLLVTRDADGGSPMDVIGGRIGLHLAADYGLTRWLQVGAALPFVLDQDGDAGLVEPDRTLPARAVGDVRLRAKLRLLARNDSLRVHLAAAAQLALPTGDEDGFAGAPGAELEPAFLASMSSGRLGGTIQLGYRWRERSDLAHLVVGDEVTVGAAVTAAALPGRLWVIGELRSAIGLEASSERERPVEVLGGGKLHLAGGWWLRSGIGFGLTHGYGAPSVRGLATVAYAPERARPAPREPAPPPADTDGDGITDDLDRCLGDPEDRDEFEDADGCPDPDNDGDGTVDLEDRCPLDAGVPENHGCVDVDGDGDGLVDRLDPCPSDAEDADGFEDADGCPEPDNDGDGIQDADDRCPREPDDLDGFEDADGCPEDDNDRDGIPDLADLCPLEPEVFNGVDDDDGCPDAGAPLAVLTDAKIEITQQVRFATKKSRIARSSYRLLATVATLLILHPEITKVRIEGHTDSRGRATYNLRLSQQRADAVLRHLVEVSGIDPARLEAIGFGEAQPIDDNRSRRGRAANRRVELVIVERQ